MTEEPEKTPTPSEAENQSEALIAPSEEAAATPFEEFLGRSPGAAAMGRWDLAVMGGYLLLVLCYFVPYMTGGQLAGNEHGDLMTEWYWKRTYLGEALREGRIPVLNPHIMSGMPFLASSQSAIFYPFNWLFAVLPTTWLLNAQTVFHFWAGLATMHWLMRRIGRSLPAAILASMVFGFSGFAILRWWAGHLPLLLQWPWTPLAVLAWCAIQSRSERRRGLARGPLLPALGLAAAMALQFLVGHPQISYYTVLLLGLLQAGWVIWSLVRRRVGPALRGTAWLAGAGAFCGALVAVQALPIAGFVKESIRAEGLPLGEQLVHSLPVHQTVMLFAPWAFGGQPELPYLRSALESRDYHEILNYVGATAFVLCLAAMLLGRRQGAPLRWAMFTTFLLTLGLSYGLNAFGFYKVFLVLLPGLESLRCPGRFGYLVTFAAALLAAFGLDGLRAAAAEEGRRGRYRLTILVLAGLLGGAVILTAILFRNGLESAAFKALIPQFPGAIYDKEAPPNFFELHFDSYVSSLAGAYLVIAATIGLMALMIVNRFRSAAVWGLVALLSVELVRFALPYRLSYIPEEFFWPKAAVELFQSDESRWRVSSGRHRADWCQAMVWNVHHVWGADPFQRTKYSKTMKVAQQLEKYPHVWPHLIAAFHTTPFTRAIGMRFLMGPASTKEGRVWKPVLDLKQDDIRIFEDRDALPRGYTVGASRTLRPDEDPSRTVNSEDFAPTATVLLSEAAPVGAPSVETGMELTAEAPGEVRITRDEAESFEATVTMKKPGWFVLMDQFLPGWTATVNGDAAHIYEANVIGRALYLPAGEHRVVMTYAAPGLRTGAWISGLGWIAWAGLAGWALFARRRPEGSAGARQAAGTGGEAGEETAGA